MRPCNPTKSSAAHESIKHAALVMARLYKTDPSTTEKQTHSHTHTASKERRSLPTVIYNQHRERGGHSVLWRVSACGVGYLITSKTRHIQPRAGRPGPRRPPGERRDMTASADAPRTATQEPAGNAFNAGARKSHRKPKATREIYMIFLQIQFMLHIGLLIIFMLAI